MLDAAAPASHEVRDGSRVIRFTGTLLAQASSERPLAARFVTLSLFALPAPPPAYVLSRVQHSRVVHDSACIQAKRNRLPSGIDPEARNIDLNHLSPCQYCNPPLPPNPHTSPDFLPNHRFELPRHFGAILNSADVLIRALAHPHIRPNKAHDLPATSTVPIPWLSQQLIDAAIPHDPAIRDAYDLTLP